jgi:uncharacterized membrane protein
MPVFHKNAFDHHKIRAREFYAEPSQLVITGLDPVIQSFFLDGRVKPGHDKSRDLFHQKLEHVAQKRIPVRVKKIRQNKEVERIGWKGLDCFEASPLAMTGFRL